MTGRNSTLSATANPRNTFDRDSHRLTEWKADERRTVERVRRGDEVALAGLVDRHQWAMTKLAMSYVHDFGAAQEVVQETWVAVIRGIGDFEGRSSLKNWIFAILINLAKARGVSDTRSIPFASCDAGDDDPIEMPVRRVARGAASGGLSAPWGDPPQAHRTPEDERSERETLQQVIRAIAELPPSQRAVIYLRDIRGLTSNEVCERLGISDVAQRVRLHKARARVRRAVFGSAGTSIEADDADSRACGGGACAEPSVGW